MAESYRPLSRHSVKIPVESSTILQTVHPMDATIHTDYGEVNVYETTVRPKSRRAEGHTRPKSGYNNRFRREGSKVSVCSPRDQPEERPRTSRGRRETSETRQSGDVTSGDLTTSRPKSGYGHRRHDVTSHHDVIDVMERPQSRRARRISHDQDRRTPPPSAGPMLQRERTFYDVNVTSSHRTQDDDRPRTRQGRFSQMSDYAGSLPSTPRNTSDPAERPRTGHGRRRQHSQGDEYSGPEASPRSSMERPPSRAGRKGQTGPDPSDYTYPVGGSTADVLVVDDERPRTGRTRRRTHYPIDLSYMSTPHDREQAGPSPSPSPRPPTGRRPKSSRRQKTTKPPASPNYEYERQMTTTTTPVPLSRPPSSTLNRFTPLPSIRPRPDAPGYHIHIPHAGESAAATSSTSTSTSALSEHAQRLHIRDPDPGHPRSSQPPPQPREKAPRAPEAEEEEEEEEGPPYPPLRRPLPELPPEPQPEDGDRVILAIKLPDGTRIQRGFRPSDMLQAVMNFAELRSQLDFGHCELVCDVPRQVYRDLRVSIRDSGLQNRTVLHVQIPDEP